MVVLAMVWRHSEVAGRLTSSCDADDKRLYACERFGAVEAWVDDVKIGNYPNDERGQGGRRAYR